MQQTLLTLNSGSSSLKFALFRISENSLESSPLCYGQIENLQDKPTFTVKDKKNKIIIQQKNLSFSSPQAVFEYVLNWLNIYLEDKDKSKVAAIGHRVIHGGDKFVCPVKINEEILQALSEYNPLAPQHQPHNIEGIRLAVSFFPDILQVACFDTAFHTTQSEIAQAFALPENIAKHPIKRYGFHGLSYEYIAHAMSNYISKAIPNERTLVAHLGHGASLCALQNRHSVATTMGFTALDGLMMSTRCGNLDPGVILYLLQEEKMSLSSINKLLYEEAGLLGVSGISENIRILLKSENPKAKKAIDLYIYRIAREMGGLIMALKGLDHLIFTGGIGENSAEVRLRVCQYLEWLGVKIHQRANTENAVHISLPHSTVSLWVIPTNEEMIIAHHTWKIWESNK